MTQHTPAPWKASQFGGSITGPDGKSICAISNNIKRDQAEKLANARLIAAAPELLKALKDLLDAQPSGCVDHYAIEAKARAAVAKATGNKQEATP